MHLALLPWRKVYLGSAILMGVVLALLITGSTFSVLFSSGFIMILSTLPSISIICNNLIFNVDSFT